MEKSSQLPTPATTHTSQRPRRRPFVLCFLAFLVFSFFFAPPLYLPLRSRLASCHSKPLSLDDRVEAILAKTPLIDGHNDLPFMTRFYFNGSIYRDDFDFESKLPGHADAPRLKAGRVGGVFWSVYAQCPKNSQNFSDATYYESVHDTLQQIDLVHRLVAEYPDHLALATTADEAVRAHRIGKVGSFIGAEGLHQIGNSASTLRQYYALGVRYITLTHMCNNKYADGALAPGGEVWGGLSPDGKKLIGEYNRVGMLVDISHVTANTMRDVLAVTKAPVMYSHSSAYAICPHDRNVPDDVLQLVKANNGVVMVNFLNDFVHCGGDNKPEDATLSHVADHIMHIGNLIGFTHVGIGSDFDGIITTPKGLEDVSKFPDLFKELLKRGVSDEDAGRIAGGNVLRVWRDVERVSRELQVLGVKPLEDEIKPIRF